MVGVSLELRTEPPPKPVVSTKFPISPPDCIKGRLTSLTEGTSSSSPKTNTPGAARAFITSCAEPGPRVDLASRVNGCSSGRMRAQHIVRETGLTAGPLRPGGGGLARLRLKWGDWTDLELGWDSEGRTGRSR